MYKLLADVKLYTESEGGMPREGFSGMRPSFEVSGELIMCEIITTSGDPTIHRGTIRELRIQLPYGEMFKEHLHVGYQFHLNVGSKKIGEGRIKSIIG